MAKKAEIKPSKDLDLLITIGVSAIIASVKNSAKKAALKKQMLRVFLAIRAAYASDPDFE